MRCKKCCATTSPREDQQFENVQAIEAAPERIEEVIAPSGFPDRNIAPSDSVFSDATATDSIIQFGDYATKGLAKPNDSMTNVLEDAEHGDFTKSDESTENTQTELVAEIHAPENETVEEKSIESSSDEIKKFSANESVSAEIDTNEENQVETLVAENKTAVSESLEPEILNFETPETEPIDSAEPRIEQESETNETEQPKPKTVTRTRRSIEIEKISENEEEVRIIETRVENESVTEEVISEFKEVISEKAPKLEEVKSEISESTIESDSAVETAQIDGPEGQNDLKIEVELRPIPNIAETTEAEVATEHGVTTESEVTSTTEVTTEPEVMTEAEVMTEPDVITEHEVMTKLEVTTENGVTTESEVTTTTEVNAEPEAMTEPEVTTELEVTTESEVMTTTEFTHEPEVEATTESELMTEPEVMTELEVTTESEVMTTTEVTTEPEVMTEPEINSEPKVEPESEVTTEMEVTAEFEVKSETEDITKVNISNQAVPNDDLTPENDAIDEIPEEISDDVMAEVMTSLPALAKSPVDEIIKSEMESPKQSPRSRSERKTKQALMKCGLKPVEGVSTVSMKTERSDLTYVVKDPEVFKSGETYLVFGEAEQTEMKSKAQELEEKMKKLQSMAEGIKQTQQKLDEVLDEVGELKLEGLDPIDLDLIMKETGVSKFKAAEALRKNDNDLVNAIMYCTK